MVVSSSYDNQDSPISLKGDANTADLVHESSQELSLRPQTFDSYIGQEKLIEILKISISAARKRNDLSSIGHILLYGPPGLGKTSCAYLLAKEIGSEAKVFSAPALERPKDILGILMSAQEGDVIFIDEIHRLNKITEELLYPALEDYQIDLSTGKGNSSRMMRLDINKFILIGATTKLGDISAPLRDRFVHLYRMEYYNVNELTQIITQNARLLGIAIEANAAKTIAERARGTPRIINRLLRLVRDFAQHNNSNQITSELAQSALDLYRIDKAGLDNMDRKVLRLLIDKYQGGPVGLEAIASLCGEDKTTIESYYEPFLVQSGLLVRTQRGRMVTDKGFEYMQ